MPRGVLTRPEPRFLFPAYGCLARLALFWVFIPGVVATAGPMAEQRLASVAPLRRPSAKGGPSVGSSTRVSPAPLVALAAARLLRHRSAKPPRPRRRNRSASTVGVVVPSSPHLAAWRTFHVEHLGGRSGLVTACFTWNRHGGLRLPEGALGWDARSSGPAVVWGTRRCEHCHGRRSFFADLWSDEAELRDRFRGPPVLVGPLWRFGDC